MTKVQLELTPHTDIYLLFHKEWEVEFLTFLKDIVKPTISIWNLVTQNKNPKAIIYLDRNNLYGYAMLKFLPTNGFTWIDPKKFDWNKYISNSSKGCVLEVDLEYPKELQELHNDYPLAPGKIEIKRELLSSYRLIIADFYNIPIGNVKELVLNFIDKE